MLQAARKKTNELKGEIELQPMRKKKAEEQLHLLAHAYIPRINLFSIGHVAFDFHLDSPIYHFSMDNLCRKGERDHQKMIFSLNIAHYRDSDPKAFAIVEKKIETEMRQMVQRFRATRKILNSFLIPNLIKIIQSYDIVEYNINNRFHELFHQFSRPIRTDFCEIMKEGVQLQNTTRKSFMNTYINGLTAKLFLAWKYSSLMLYHMDLEKESSDYFLTAVEKEYQQHIFRILYHNTHLTPMLIQMIIRYGQNPQKIHCCAAASASCCYKEYPTMDNSLIMQWQNPPIHVASPLTGLRKKTERYLDTDHRINVENHLLGAGIHSFWSNSHLPDSFTEKCKMVNSSTYQIKRPG